MALLCTPEERSELLAPSFALKGIDNATHTLEGSMGINGMAVFFICNHCPYVITIIDRLVKTAKTLQENGIGVIGIMPNDTETYSDDSFENMKKFASKYDFTFPYLIDETQEIAKAYGAICTPDLYAFNAKGALQYRGRLDSASNAKKNENTVEEFLNAALQIAETGMCTTQQIPSMGCSIKWRT